MSLPERLRKRWRRAAGSLRELETRRVVSSSIFRSRLHQPDFLGIGVQKGGTTWLYENLRRHPDVFLPHKKELHFFNGGSRRSIWWYSSQLAPGRGRVKGEVTPEYCILDAERVGTIRSLNPRLTAILLLRHPVERAWSHAVKNLFEIPGRQAQEVPLEEIFMFLRSPLCKRRTDYQAMLDVWQSVFPARQIVISTTDEIEQNPRGLLESLFERLGVHVPDDIDEYPLHDRIRPIYTGRRVERGTVQEDGTSIAMPPRVRRFLEVLYGQQIELLKARLGGLVEHW